MTSKRVLVAELDAAVRAYRRTQRVLDKVSRQRDDLRAELASTRNHLLAHERQLEEVRAQRDRYRATTAKRPPERWAEAYASDGTLIRSGLATYLEVRALPDTGPEPREVYPDLWRSRGWHRKVTFADGDTVTADRITIRLPFRKES